MSPVAHQPPNPSAVGTRRGTSSQPLLPGTATHAWAVGTLMAMTPCSAREAHRILAVAADLARTTPDAVAAAMVAARRGGTPLPAHLERAVRRAMEAAREPVPSNSRPSGLRPARARAEEALVTLRACQARLADSPDDAEALRAMDDAAYTLCVLMDRPTVHTAVLAALEHLAARTG